MLEEITKGIRENGIMKIDIQDTNAFSIREVVKLYGGVKLKTGIPVKTKMRITQISG